MSKNQTADQLDRVKEVNKELRASHSEKDKLLSKTKRAANEAIEHGKASIKKFGRLATAVENRESVVQDVAAFTAGAIAALGVHYGTNWAVEKVGNAIPAVGRNAGYVQAGTSVLVGVGAYAGERYFRKSPVPSLGEQAVSQMAKVEVLLGVIRGVNTYRMAGARQQAAIASAMAQAQAAQAAQQAAAARVPR